MSKPTRDDLRPVIVKVQRPLAQWGMPSDHFLVYAKGNNRMQQVTPDKQLRDLMGSDVKKFFYATWKGGHWVVGAVAPWQEW